jgi:hypothetical protein
VWANGGCYRADSPWNPLHRRWAKAGFVVLALSAPGGNANIAAALQSTDKGHHGALIDWVYKQNESGPYAGKLDLERIVASGNSCGGESALGLTAEDDRVAAIFVLSGSSSLGSSNQQVMNNIKVPLGFVEGGPEDMTREIATIDYNALGDGIPGMFVTRFAGEHMEVSTNKAILAEAVEIALNWMDLALYGTQAAYDQLMADVPCEKCTPDHWTVESKNLETLLVP